MSRMIKMSLGKIGQVKMCKRVLKEQTSENEKIPFYKISTFGEEANTFISNELFLEFKEKYSYPNKGDILISAAGTVGKTVIFDGKPSYFQDSNIVWIENNEKIILNRFLYYFYQTKPWQTTNGSTITRIYNEDLRSIKLTFPESLSTQQKIASVLSALDDKIELNNRINAELEAMAKTLYDYWFVQFDFPTHSHCEERGTRDEAIHNKKIASLHEVTLAKTGYKSSGGKMVYNETLKREIPEGWEVKNIKEVCEIVDCLHSKKPEYKFEDENFYLLQLENLLDNGLIDISKKYFVSEVDYKNWTNRITVKEHDILFTNAGRVAQTTQLSKEIVSGIGRNITAVRPINISPTFCFLSINSYDVQKQIFNNIDQGAFFQSFNVKGIKLLNFIVPPKDVQVNFEKIVYNIRRKRELNLKQNQELSALRDWLLPMLMNGQVKVGMLD